MPDWIAESVCFYGAALCAAMPACIVEWWWAVFFRIVRRIVGAQRIFNGGRLYGGVYRVGVEILLFTLLVRGLGQGSPSKRTARGVTPVGSPIG